LYHAYIDEETWTLRHVVDVKEEEERLR